MPNILWTANDIASVTQGKLTNGDFAVTGISIDTRTLQKGDLFIALKGPHSDGHDFIDDAFAKGAACVLAQQGIDGKRIIVPDTFTALQDMGAGARVRSKATILAVTGSVGKTSVKAMLAAAFAEIGETHAAEASLNNHWGVPLSLARMPQSAEFAIFEIGMNHENEIAPLSKLVSPHLSIITTIANAHIEHLKTIENIALAKAEIFQGMDANGVAILPLDSAQYPLLLAEARTQGLQRILSFGEHKDADVQLVSIQENEQGSLLGIRLQDQRLQVEFGMPGRHQAVNVLSVLAAFVALGIDPVRTLPALQNLRPVTGRGNRTQLIFTAGKAPIDILDETHNASPIAVKAALKTLDLYQSATRRIVILGDMLELGPESPDLHAGLAEAVRKANPDLILLCGKMMAHLAKALGDKKTRHYPDSAALVEEIGTLVSPGDAIMVKGSRGSKMRLVIDALHGLGQVKAPPENARPLTLHPLAASQIG